MCQSVKLSLELKYNSYSWNVGGFICIRSAEHHKVVQKEIKKQTDT